MNDFKFLVEKLFADNTKHGIVPLTLEDYISNYTLEELDKVLREILFGLDLFEGED